MPHSRRSASLRRSGWNASTFAPQVTVVVLGCAKAGTIPGRGETSADAWRQEVAGLSAHVEGANEDVARERSRVEALAWRYGV
jgi:hypothetical protein